MKYGYFKEMSVYSRSSERRKLLTEYRMREEEFAATLGRPPISQSPKVQLEEDKRMRREIANSNERRRMQSINTGFQSLKTLLPHREGEKLSKAAILQQTSEYIHSLEQEKTKLLSQNAHLKSLLNEMKKERLCDSVFHDSPPPKRKKRDTESSDEGITVDFNDENGVDDIRREMIDLRCQLDRERRMRMMLEERSRVLESKLYPENLHEIASHVHKQVQIHNNNLLCVERIKEEEEQEDRLGLVQPVSESMSRRNLETIVEAIRHLEGDRITLEDSRKLEMRRHVLPPHSEESEKESSINSDPEDTKSECSEIIEIPVSYIQQVQTVTSQPHIYQSSFHEKYPIASELLHRPLNSQYICRPGVIVQKS